MPIKTLFWIFVGFYVTVKICYFVGVYLITKAIERKALAEKKKRLEHNRLVELEGIVEMYEKREKAFRKDKEIYGARHGKFIA
ncbi:MAG: hypothetical protein GX295_07975 [Syntrophomonadaceae bacterium]|nr:hypothetical protein [Syntrophomonadaceae bacterium]